MAQAQTPTSNGSWQVYPNYTGTDKVTAPVWLLPPSFTYSQSSTLTVGQLYLGDGGFASYTYSNDDFAFSFTAQRSGPPYQSNVAATITLSGSNNIWKVGTTARTSLATNFLDLVTWVESTLELPGIVVPGSTGRIGRSIIVGLPLAFSEVLSYQYSLSTGLAGGTNAYIDLLPGMRLRLETGISQFLAPSSPQNGYVAAGALSISIGSTATGDGARMITCDPFLGMINAPVVTATGQPAEVAGGIIDLQAAGAARGHWRLFYPTIMAAPNQPGSTQLTGNVGLMTSATLTQLIAATAKYPTPVSDGGTGGDPAATLYYVFSGRAIAIPEIPIWLTANGQTGVEYVPVGTTIANVVERFTDVPLGAPSNVINLMRNVYGASPASLRYTLGALPATPLGVYDLPLLSGDGLTLTV